MKRFLIYLLAFTMLISLASCDKGEQTGGTQSTTEAQGTAAILYQSELVSGKFSKFDLQENCVYNGAVVFGEASHSFTGTGIFIDGNTVTITKAGCYRVTGQSSNAQLIIDAGDLDKVHLVVEGVNLRSQNSAPLWVKNADKVVVTLKGGTVNTFADGNSFPEGDNMPNAVIYSRDSISFNGDGKLVVEGSLYNGISCSNDLKFISGEYEISAANNGVKGKDSVAILSATMKITAGKDGIKSDALNEAGKGFVYIAGGNIEIHATDDGIQANDAIDLQGGTYLFVCDGKTINAKGAYHIDQSVIIREE